MTLYLLALILAVMAVFASFGVGAFAAVFTDNRRAHLLAGLIAMLTFTTTTTWILAKV